MEPQSKLATAGCRAFEKTAIDWGALGSSAMGMLRGAGQKVMDAGKGLFQKAPAAAAPVRAGGRTASIGGVQTPVSATGKVLYQSAPGTKSIMGSHADPAIRDMQTRHLSDMADKMSFKERHNFLTQAIGENGKALREDTRWNRFKANSLDFMSKNPLAHAMIPLAGQAAMSFIPAGRDEYGYRRSLADTTAGQLVAGIGLPIATMSAPGYVLGNTSAGALGSVRSVMQPGKPHIVNSPPPAGSHPISRAGMGVMGG